MAAKSPGLVAFLRLGNPSCGSTGVKLLLRLLLGLLWPGLLAGATPLEHARRAQAMLGPETWSEVIRIENTSVHGAYPATIYALVFE